MNRAQQFALNKLLEECGELVTIVAKLGMFPDGYHPSRKFEGLPIWPDVAEEIADVRAAMCYFLKQFPEVPLAGLEARKQEKLELYEQYVNESE
jgi:NTP pyrophosphatase (non-canonical NTP hydrolase)